MLRACCRTVTGMSHSSRSNLSGKLIINKSYLLKNTALSYPRYPWFSILLSLALFLSLNPV